MINLDAQGFPRQPEFVMPTLWVVATLEGNPSKMLKFADVEPELVKWFGLTQDQQNLRCSGGSEYRLHNHLRYTKAALLEHGLIAQSLRKGFWVTPAGRSYLEQNRVTPDLLASLSKADGGTR